jgi:ribosome-binding protein aMBF1 (putative translation factor)
MITCDLCGEAKDCLQKEIEGKEYDICPECWKPFDQKLRGKGATQKEREDEEKPGPEEPPKIWGEVQPN